MTKHGIIHDYDLMANNEQSARGVTCAVCDTQATSFQWSDYHGEGMCRVCGCPYQLKAGGKEREAEGKYPYLNLVDSFLPLAREYWQTHKRWVHYGSSLSRDDGIAALNAWVRATHPEYITKERSDD